jgi:hypothetical protein
MNAKNTSGHRAETTKRKEFPYEGIMFEGRTGQSEKGEQRK